MVTLRKRVSAAKLVSATLRIGYEVLASLSSKVTAHELPVFARGNTATAVLITLVVGVVFRQN